MVRMGMESKFHSKRILGLLTILPLFASISIVNNFGEAFADSELDFNECTGFLSADQVKTIVGYSGELEVINSDTTQKAQEANPNMVTQCTLTFKPTIDSVLALMVSEFNSADAADERYTKSLESFLQGGFEGIKGEFDDWKTFEVSSDKTLVKNLLAAQYQTYVISLSTSLTDENLAVADDLKNLSTIVLEKLGMDADTITKDREELKIEVEEYLHQLSEKEALDKSESASDHVSEGDPLTEAPVHEEKPKQISEGDPLTEAPVHEEKTKSPYYQLKRGTAAKDISCNDGFELILNPLSGSPNCVKPYTASVLIKRGWTTQ